MEKRNSAERMQDALTDIRDEYIIEAARMSDLEASGKSQRSVSDDRFEPDNHLTPDHADIYPVPKRKDRVRPGKIMNIRLRRFWPAAAACAAIAVISGIGVASLSYNKAYNTSSSAESYIISGHTKSADAPKAEHAKDDSDGGYAYEAADEAIAAVPSAGSASMAVDRTGDGAMFSPAYGVVNSAEHSVKSEAEATPLPYDGEDGDIIIDGPMTEPTPFEQASSFVLTAGIWNDNNNWPFFTNLVNSGTISFPSYGLDPRSRIEVVVTDEDGNALRGETVRLLDSDGAVIWTAKTDKNGRAYLFSKAGSVPSEVSVNGATAPVTEFIYEEHPEDITDGDDSGQGTIGTAMRSLDEIHISTEKSAEISGLQVMFVIDTTGSMSDEIAYLQKDFSSIAGEVGGDVSWSVNFYRDDGDKYVTKCFDFTDDVSYVQSLINTEYAEGGGDTPEAVSRILEETITENDGWDENSSKLLFLVFDAPPHDDEEVYKVLDAVRTAADKGIRIVPVVASNAERDTEVFGRALSIMTGADYVFLTDDSGVGKSHLEPIIGDYEVELLHDIIVRLINEAKQNT